MTDILPRISMSRFRLILISGIATIAVSACASPAPSEPDLLETAVMGTVNALASLPPMTATPTPSQTPTRTSTPTLTPTATETPTPLPPMASVSLATNCRKGPGAAYAMVVALQPGQVAEVSARSTAGDFWYVANPDQPDEHCWLWGEHASIEGDVSTLPEFTPEPAPIPKLDFTVHYRGSMQCGSWHVSFIVINSGRTSFQSARIYVQDLNHPDDIHGPAVDRHPFAPSPSSCPPGHGNHLPPGAAAFVVVPISPARAGNDGLANIKLCTEDWGGGDCVSKQAFFRIPGE